MNKQLLFPYTALTDRFSGAFAKFLKATLTSSCLSVRPEQLSSHWTDFN